MNFIAKRKPNERPWECAHNPATETPEDKDYYANYKKKKAKFYSICYENVHLDKSTMIAAIEASESVVSLVSYSDDEMIFQGSGSIIECDGTILTSAKLVTCPKSENEVAKNIKISVHLWDEKEYMADVLAYDFYFGIAVVKINPSGTQLKPACLKLVDDCVSLGLSTFTIHDDSKAYNLVPGDKIIALGRYFIKPYDLMAAPGIFSIRKICGNFKCEELFRATCLISRCGTGGSIINQRGEVIGIASCYDKAFTPFVPLNFALKWWEHYGKVSKLSRRPLLGMKMTNLYTTELRVLEKLIQNFPDLYTGVIVEEVKQGSSAGIAGICTKDIIVQCCGKTVWSFLELFDLMWDKIGESVKLTVIRASDNYASLDLNMKIDEAG